MGRLIDADAIIQFPYSPESGTSDMIENWLEEVGLCGESVDFDEGITEKARELCKLVIEGFINIIITEPTAYDVKKVKEELENEMKFWEDSYDYQIGKEKARSYSHAIEIVKGGGVE